MITIKASERGIIKDKDVTVELNSLLRELSAIDEEKELIFDNGSYYINSKDCVRDYLYITNTIGDSEWKENEKEHLISIAIHFKNINNLKVLGNGAVFIIDGQVTNIVIDNCKNILLSDISIKTINPDMHELRVRSIKPFSIDFELDKESAYTKEGSSYIFIGKDYMSEFKEKSLNAFWIGKFYNNNSNSLERTSHPLRGAIKINEISPYCFRAYYLLKKKFLIGDRFYIFDVRRKNVGIFVNRSKDIVLYKVNQYFNYSLALVAQDTENITVEKAYFAPEKESSKMMASLADFMQICMCRGNVTICDSIFEGSGDDALNVHGIHFSVINILNNVITLRFMHPQTHGFNPLRVGDEIEYIDKDTLLTKGKGRILSSKLINEYEIEIKADNVNGCMVNDVIEDITACPSLYYLRNRLNRVITRGLLVTTRGKVKIENNDFADTSMNSIVFSNDARSWFESGRVLNVIIRNNRFGRCPAKNILIKPENKVHKGPVHSNFVIEGNVFDSGEKGGIFIKSSSDIIIKNNKISNKSSKFLCTKNVTNIVSDIKEESKQKC